MKSCSVDLYCRAFDLNGIILPATEIEASNSVPAYVSVFRDSRFDPTWKMIVLAETMIVSSVFIVMPLQKEQDLVRNR